MSTDWDALAARLAPWAERDLPLGPLTTYRVGGAAAVGVRVPDAGALAAVAGVLASSARDVPVVVVGRGSNLLVADRGFAGVAVLLGDDLAHIEVDGTVVRAGGAALLPVVARRTVAAGLTGFEWAVGVPGSIGGAVRMNAGGHGADLAASLRGVRVVDLRTGQDDAMSVASLDLGYRRSALAPHQVVTEATLGLEVGDRARGEEELAAIVRWRRANQPGGANAGSVFANPPGKAAGQLIDRAGGKALRVGGAEVSPKHANFIQADATAPVPATAADVLAVMVAVCELVERDSGVVLHPETRLVGFRPSELPDAWLRHDPRLLIEG